MSTTSPQLCQSCPASHVADWVASLGDSGRKHSTIHNYITAVSAHHRDDNLEDPTLHPKVQLCKQGVRRAQGGKTALSQRFAVTMAIKEKADAHMDLQTHRGRLLRLATELCT
jgi:hypothetical protein